MSCHWSDADIERIALGLIGRSLPKPEWTHAAHFAAALWFVKWRGALAATEMPPAIRAYNESTGVANTDSGGYHETITLASLRAARAWLDARPDATLSAALAEMLEGRCGLSDWLLEYWSKERLFSVEARRGWIEPDLRKLPF